MRTKGDKNLWTKTELPESLSYLTPQLIEALIDNPYECPVVIDDRGVVRFMSRYNEKLYGLTQTEALGKHITEVIKNTRMPEVLNTGVAQIGKTMKLGNKYRIVARIPLRDKEGKLIGVLGKLMFHQPEKIRDLYFQLEVLKEQLQYYKQEVNQLRKDQCRWEGIIGDSPLMLIAKKEASKAASSDAPVLITGESGTGKELFASAIHYSSKRARGPFIRVNCAAIPQELLESELFGYEPGAFTGASSKGKPGKFELAHGGTIFLDEIGDMPFSTQVKLLRIIQEKEVERVGSTKPKKVDFRVIAATNKDLSEEMKRGHFRSDLFFRLKIFHITTPPLREIVEDIPKIAYSLLSELIQRAGRPSKRISKEVMDVFKRYPWPGNVREMKNVLERALYVAEREEIALEDLPKEMQGFMEIPRQRAPSGPLKEAVAVAERASIEEALKKAKGNKALASRLLGIHRTALYQKLKRYGIRTSPI